MLPLEPNRRTVCTLLILIVTYGLLAIILVGRAPHRQAGALFVSDGFGYYIYLPSLVIDGDLDLSNQLTHQPNQPEQSWYQYVEVTHRPGNCFQIGCAVLWFPFFLLAHGMVILFNTLGATIPQDGFGFAYELPVYVGSFTYGLFGLRYLWLLLRELWGETVAVFVTFYIATTTALAAYLWFEPDMSHVVSMFLITVLFYYTWRAYQLKSINCRAWGGLGFLLGLIAAVRVPDLLVGIVPGLTALAVGRSEKPEWRTTALCFSGFAAGIFFGFAPQMLVWKSLYGGYLTRPPGVYQTMNWLNPDLLGYFFSRRRGLVVWTPLLFPAILGLTAAFVRGQLLLRLAFLVFVAAVYFNSSIPQWWVGCSFGERRIVDYSIVFALGLGYLMSLRPNLCRKPLLHTIGITFFVSTWVLMFRYFTHDLPEYGDVSWYDLYGRNVSSLWRIVEKLVGLVMVR